MNTATHLLTERYYTAFNKADWTTFISLLAEDVVHDINQGERQTGRDVFAKFMERMNKCYREQIVDISILTSADGTRGSAEFTVIGEYVSSDEGLPPAHGQKYRLPGGAFFEYQSGKITRVTNYYNLQEWLRQVRA